MYSGCVWEKEGGRRKRVLNCLGYHGSIYLCKEIQFKRSIEF